MKVVLAVCGTNQYRGLPKYFYFLAKHLILNGIEVELIVDSPKGIGGFKEVLGGAQYFPPEGAAIYSEVRVIGPVCQEGRLNVLKTAIWCWRVAQYLKGKDFDVLHCGHITPYFYLRQKNRKPVVFQPFGNELIAFGEVYTGLSKWYYKLSQGVLRYCGRETDILLAEADWQLEEMEKFYGRKDMFILPVGIDIDFINEKARNTKVTRKVLDIKDSDLVLLTVNTFHPHKDYPNLLKAIQILKNRIPNLVSIQVGDGPEWEKCWRMMFDLGIEGNIIPLRGVSEEDLYGLYRLADCYVSPTQCTDFQMGIMEAEALGLPIVSTAQEFQFNLGKGRATRNGIIVEMGDPRALAGAIEVVYKAEPSRKQWGKRSREVVKQWDFKEIAKKTIEIYKEVVW